MLIFSVHCYSDAMYWKRKLKKERLFLDVYVVKTLEISSDYIFVIVLILTDCFYLNYFFLAMRERTTAVNIA